MFMCYMDLSLSVCIHIYIYIYIFRHTCIHLSLYIYIYIYIHKLICVYLQTHTLDSFGIPLVETATGNKSLVFVVLTHNMFFFLFLIYFVFLFNHSSNSTYFLFVRTQIYYNNIFIVFLLKLNFSQISL